MRRLAVLEQPTPPTSRRFETSGRFNERTAKRRLRLQPEAELPDSRKLKGFETDPGSFDSRIL